jgi:hypothetical protein
MDRQERSAPLRLQLKGPVRDDPRGGRVVGAGLRAGFDASLAAELIAKDSASSADPGGRFTFKREPSGRSQFLRGCGTIEPRSP